MADTALAGFFALKVKSQYRDAFIDASIKEARSVIGEEPGSVQFQMLADASDPNRFYFFEVYRDEAAAMSHMETQAFKTMRRAVEPMLDGEVEILATMHTLFPPTPGGS
ncbi:putative quinol monooxygenase [uncultured Ruegeria sp.]|uniref:putative quinol monooxygenase n=1 Tax=uncultured Ruegeria sp. TaxID=259304 RepID=UPI0026060226|nr:putative quinol monooxygenase [uncultured Ruegeria sp.]